MLWLSMIVKNEMENLIRNHIWNFCWYDSILIVDTWSSDWTKELLSNKWIQYKKFELNKKDKMSLIKARNFSIHENDSDWVLVLDADEYIDKKDIEKIKQDLKNNTSNTGGYFIKILDHRHWTPFEDYKLCLLKRDFWFEWYVHANPQVFFRKNNLEAKFLPDITIHHHPISFSELKIDKYIEQIIFGISQDNLNTRYLWFLWYSLFKRNHISEAKKYLENAFSLKSLDYPVETLNTWMILSSIFLKEGNFELAKNVNMETILFFKSAKNDFEVKVNYRIEKTLEEIANAIEQKDREYQVYQFMY